MKKKTQLIVSDKNLAILQEEHDTYLRDRRNVSPETIKEYHTYLKRFFYWLLRNYKGSFFRQFDFSKLRKFIDLYYREYPLGSCRWMRCSLRSFLRFCYLEGYLRCNLTPLLPMRRPLYTKHVPKILSDDDLIKIVSGLKQESLAEKRDYAIFLLLMCYGVRGSQIRALRLDDIDWDAERINFPAAKNGNNTSQPLLPEVGNALVEYITNGRPACEQNHLFLTLKDPPTPLLASSILSSIIARRLKDVGVAVPRDSLVGSHIFRHTFASRLLKAEEPLKNISDMLGHRDYDSTLIYTKIDIFGLKNASLNWEDSYYEKF